MNAMGLSPYLRRCLFLSNGEIGIAEKVAEDGHGRKVTAGQQVRVIDIPAVAGAGLGLFETFTDSTARMRSPGT